MERNNPCSPHPRLGKQLPGTKTTEFAQQNRPPSLKCGSAITQRLPRHHRPELVPYTQSRARRRRCVSCGSPSPPACQSAPVHPPGPSSGRCAVTMGPSVTSPARWYTAPVPQSLRALDISIRIHLRPAEGKGGFGFPPHSGRYLGAWNIFASQCGQVSPTSA